MSAGTRYCQRCGDVPDAHVVGWQIQGVYDGVLIWQHIDCGFAWPRFSADVPDLHRKGLEHIARMNHPTGRAS